MWYRKVRVVVRDPQGETLMDINDTLRMDFLIDRRSGGDNADTLKLDIYNLSSQTIKALLDFTNIKDFNSKPTFFFYAGYEDEIEEGRELPEVFQGIAVNVFSRKVQPDHITSIYVVTRKGIVRNTTVYEVAKDTMPYIDFMKSIFLDLGLVSNEKDWAAIPDDIKNQPMRSVNTKDTQANVLHKYLTLNNIEYVIFDDTISLTTRLLKKEETLEQLREEGKIIRELRRELLRSTPTIELAKADIEYRMSTEFRVLDIITGDFFGKKEATSTEGQEALINGIVNMPDAQELFRVEEVETFLFAESYWITRMQHRGSNFGDKWSTLIQASAHYDGKASASTIEMNKQTNVQINYAGGTNVN